MLRRSIVLALIGAAALVLAAGPAFGALVTVRVEGKTQTIFGATQPKAVATNALDALEAASLAGEFYYHVTQTSFGPYVDQIGRYPGAGSTGWVFKVDNASPPVGADKVVLQGRRQRALVLRGLLVGLRAEDARARRDEAGLLPRDRLRRCRGSRACARCCAPGRRPHAQGLLHEHVHRPAQGARPRDCARHDPFERSAVRYAAALLVLLAVALTGCGEQGTHGTATLWITQDRGAHVLLARSVPAGETAMQALTRAGEAEDALRRPLRAGDRRHRRLALRAARLVLLRERDRSRAGARPR